MRGDYVYMQTMYGSLQGLVTLALCPSEVHLRCPHYTNIDSPLPSHCTSRNTHTPLHLPCTCPLLPPHPTSTTHKCEKGYCYTSKDCRWFVTHIVNLHCAPSVHCVVIGRKPLSQFCEFTALKTNMTETWSSYVISLQSTCSCDDSATKYGHTRIPMYPKAFISAFKTTHFSSQRPLCPNMTM